MCVYSRRFKAYLLVAIFDCTYVLFYSWNKKR